MKQIFLFAILAFAFMSQAQTDKIQWKTEVEKLKDGTYQVELIGTIEDGWYIYSQFMDAGGPVPTKIEFIGASIAGDGKSSEFGKVTKENYDDVFELDIKKFGEEVRFTQVLSDVSSDGVTANVTFMTCNDEVCLPPKQEEIPIYFE